MTVKDALCIQLGSAPANDPAAIAAESLKAAHPGDSSKYESLQVIVSASEMSACYNPMQLASYTSLLQDNGVVTIKVVGDEAIDLKPIHTSFLLAGLVGASERKEADGSRVLTANKKPNTNITAAPLKMSDEDLIDEDNLLNDSSNLLAPPPSMSAAATKSGDDCAGREPCADCSCGRSSGGEAGDKKEIKTSSCGKCHLGDAFRCASCPYLGKPAFKPGEEHLVLDLQDDI